MTDDLCANNRRQDIALSGSGTISFVLELPWPWPPKKKLSFLERILNETFIEAYFDKSGVLHVVTKFKDKLTSLSTGSLSQPQHTAASITIRWSPGMIDLFINGTNISAGGTFSFRARPIVGYFDFSEENVAAIWRRRSTMMGVHPQHGRSRADDAYIFSGLVSINRQIDDLFELVSAGKMHHYHGLATLARSAIADTKSKTGGLVQWCAATLDTPLIIYTSSNPRAEVPIIDSLVEKISFNGSSTQRTLLANPVDLDVWLKFNAAVINGRKFTNGEVINKVASTISAHFDIDKHPLVDSQLKYLSEFGGIKMDNVKRYIQNAAKIAYDLSSHLIYMFEKR